MKIKVVGECSNLLGMTFSHPFIDGDNTNIRYVIKSQVLAMRRKVRGE